jgi:hypothetical protein
MAARLELVQVLGVMSVTRKLPLANTCDLAKQWLYGCPG